MLIVALANLLVWTANVFEIIHYASKEFALYYVMQTIISFLLQIKLPKKTSLAWFKLARRVCLAILLILVIGWSIPAPHN